MSGSHEGVSAIATKFLQCFPDIVLPGCPRKDSYLPATQVKIYQGAQSLIGLNQRHESFEIFVNRESLVRS